MFKPRTSFKDIILGIKNVSTAPERHPKPCLKLDKVLILSKLSRYEFEKHKFDYLNDKELEKELRSRGTDFEKLTSCHDLHKKFEKSMVDTLRQLRIDVEVVNRFNYTEDKVQWADVVIPTGGDGTFLLAASKIRNNEKPVIGFNSDPNRSEGHLCLPKKCSTDIRKTVEKIQKSDFNWLMRSRIRIKLITHMGDVVPKYLHGIQYNGTVSDYCRKNELKNLGKVLPVLALNEVFVGETLSSRVSHLEMRLNGSIEKTSMKCSGVCLCTGTGSTSWHLSINRLPTQSVAELLRLIQRKCPDLTLDAAHDLADIYNKNLIFKPDDGRMCYTVRDLISAGVWPNPKGIKSRDFVTKLEIKSNCFEARLVVDGGVSFDFNDGTIALFEVRPEDALRTAVVYADW